MRRVVCLLLFIVLVSPPTIRPGTVAQESPRSDPSSMDTGPVDSVPATELERQFEMQLEGPLKAQEIAATSTWISSAGVVDWLGPLAPVALSPFFGVTCLSGMALWGPQWATDNMLLQTQGPLQSKTLFFVFLALTVLSSVPRFTKVSKPFAQAVDRLETYSVIVILLVIKIGSSMESSGEMQIALVQLGIVSFTLDTLLAIAMVFNVLVINSVKFFFEFMVWLTPVPFLDAVFEVCNKAVCAVLMAIYALSPTLATVINLLMLLVAAIALRWISRRVRFYRTMVLDPIIAKLWSGFAEPKRTELIVFPKYELGPFKAKSRLRLSCADDGHLGWILEEANWWMPAKQHRLAADPQPRIRCGWVMNSVETNAEDGSEISLSFSRRYDGETLEVLITQLGMQVSSETVAPTERELKYEFA